MSCNQTLGCLRLYGDSRVSRAQPRINSYEILLQHDWLLFFSRQNRFAETHSHLQLSYHITDRLLAAGNKPSKCVFYLLNTKITYKLTFNNGFPQTIRYLLIVPRAINKEVDQNIFNFIMFAENSTPKSEHGRRWKKNTTTSKQEVSAHSCHRPTYTFIVYYLFNKYPPPPHPSQPKVDLELEYMGHYIVYFDIFE